MSVTAGLARRGVRFDTDVDRLSGGGKAGVGRPSPAPWLRALRQGTTGGARPVPI